jgi:hypothetical protein
MIVVVAVILAVGALLFTLAVRRADLRDEPAASPETHWEEKKAAIYGNLRDLQFEYRVGKLSDDDYQASKKVLQSELAGVAAVLKKSPGAVAAPAVKPAPGKLCPRCGATFAQPLKFCGECGAPMTGGAA